MAWGGARSGSGRKPEKSKPAPRSPFAVHDGGAASSTDLREPPEGLAPSLAVYWRKYAPKAIEANTLSPSTVPNFELLCEVHEQKDRILKEVRAGALVGLGLLATYTKQLQSLHKDYKLGAFGKAVDGARPKQAVNPFAKVSGA